MKILLYSESIINKIGVKCGDKAVEIPAHPLISPPIVSAELARVQLNLEIDLELQKLKFYAVLILC